MSKDYSIIFLIFKSMLIYRLLNEPYSCLPFYVIFPSSKFLEKKATKTNLIIQYIWIVFFLEYLMYNHQNKQALTHKIHSLILPSPKKNTFKMEFAHSQKIHYPMIGIKFPPLLSQTADAITWKRRLILLTKR